MPSWQTCRHQMHFHTSWLCTWVEGVWIKSSLPCCKSMCVYHTRWTKSGSWPCSAEAVECMKCESEPSQWAGKEGDKLAFLEHGRLISSVYGSSPARTCCVCMWVCVWGDDPPNLSSVSALPLWPILRIPDGLVSCASGRHEAMALLC